LTAILARRLRVAQTPDKQPKAAERASIFAEILESFLDAYKTGGRRASNRHVNAGRPS
jgi:hypothetical protein